MTTTNDNDLRARGEAMLAELRAMLEHAPLPVLVAVADALREMRQARGNPKQRQDDPAQDRPATGYLSAADDEILPDKRHEQMF